MLAPEPSQPKPQVPPSLGTQNGLPPYPPERCGSGSCRRLGANHFPPGASKNLTKTNVFSTFRRPGPSRAAPGHSGAPRGLLPHQASERSPGRAWPCAELCFGVAPASYDPACQRGCDKARFTGPTEQQAPERPKVSESCRTKNWFLHFLTIFFCFWAVRREVAASPDARGGFSR